MVAQRAAGRALGIPGARVQDLAAVRAPGRPRPRRGGTGDRGQQGAGLAARHDGRSIFESALRSRRFCRFTSEPGTSSSAWRRPIPATPAGSATSRSASSRIGDVQRAQGNLDAALEAYRGQARHPREAGRAGPEQRRVAARPLGQLQQDRRRAERAGQSRRRAQGLPGRPCHPREAGRAGPEQRRVAARPLGQLQQDRRRAERAGQSRRRAQGLRGRARHRREAGRAGPEQHRAGSATSRSASTRSATCRARGAISTPRSRPIRTASPSPRSWPRRTRATPSGSATSRSASSGSATCSARGAISTPRSRPIRTASPSARSWPRRTRATPSWQRDLSVSFKGSATCSARGAISTPRSRPTGRARHRREAGRAGPEQHRVAARR